MRSHESVSRMLKVFFFIRYVQPMTTDNVRDIIEDTFNVGSLHVVLLCKYALLVAYKVTLGAALKIYIRRVKSM